MRITELADIRPKPRSVAIGEFDGVHLGHRKVIEGSDTVLTFEPHPRLVLDPDSDTPLLTSLDAKAELIAELGVQELIVVPFHERFAALPSEAFIEMLVRWIGATDVSVGRNFRFGQRAEGDVERLAAERRFRTRVVDLLEVAGGVVSSSRIRALVQAGELDGAARLLGAPFRIHAGSYSRSFVCPPAGNYQARADGRLVTVSVRVDPETGNSDIQVHDPVELRASSSQPSVEFLSWFSDDHGLAIEAAGPRVAPDVASVHGCDRGMTRSFCYVDPAGNAIDVEADEFGSWRAERHQETVS